MRKKVRSRERDPLRIRRRAAIFFLLSFFFFFGLIVKSNGRINRGKRGST